MYVQKFARTYFKNKKQTKAQRNTRVCARTALIYYRTTSTRKRLLVDGGISRRISSSSYCRVLYGEFMNPKNANFAHTIRQIYPTLHPKSCDLQTHTHTTTHARTHARTHAHPSLGSSLTRFLVRSLAPSRSLAALQPLPPSQHMHTPTYERENCLLMAAGKT